MGGTDEGEIFEIGIEGKTDACDDGVDAGVGSSFGDYIAEAIDDISVAAIATVHLVVAAAAIKPVIAVAAKEGVIACIALQNIRGFVAGKPIAGSIAGGVQGVAASQNGIFYISGQSDADIGGDGVVAAACGFYRTVAGRIEDVYVIARAACHGVVAPATVERVIAAAAVKPVIASTA